VAGGAIYLNNPQFLTIDRGCIFNDNRAKNSSILALKSVRGSGGSIYYECNENSLNCIVDITDASFFNNYAEIKGGAIHWNTLEPLWGGITSNGNLTSIKFSKNKAGRYGDNISAIAQ
jgi:predicted outer membrane repeat protein